MRNRYHEASEKKPNLRQRLVPEVSELVPEVSGQVPTCRKQVPTCRKQAPTPVGNATVRDVFFILNQHVIYSEHASRVTPTFGAVMDFFQ